MPYQEDIRAALDTLREQEFRAGRFYQPPERQPGFFGRILGRWPSKPKPPASIRGAMRISGATGTRSILDIERISDTPEYHAVLRVSRDELRRLLGTEQPAREVVEQCEELTECVDRGQGICVVTYKQEEPDGIYFAGYSFD